jgi:hypothetical protein
MKQCQVLLVLILLFGCKKYTPTVTAINQLPLTIGNGQAIRADDYSIIPLVLSEGPDSLSDSVKIYPQSTLGKIIDTPYYFINRQAVIYFKMTEDTGMCRLRFLLYSSGVFLGERDSVFPIQTAHVDSVAFETNLTVSSTTSATIINTYLLRHTGFPTKAQTVTWAAYQFSASGQPMLVGRFLGVTDNFSDSLGRLSPISFFSDTKNIDTTMGVSVVAISTNDAGKSVADTLHIIY